MEGGALQQDDFVEFSKSYVLFCHITSRVADAPHQDLLQKKGGRGFPHFAFLDAEGNVIAKHEGQRSAADFSKTGEKAKQFLDLKAKAASGDAAAKLEYFLIRTELGHLNLEQARKESADLARNDDDKKKVAAALADLEVMEILNSLKDKKELPEAGRKFLVMEKEGRIPTGEMAMQGFWIGILEAADADKDAATYERSLKALEPIRSKYADNPNAKKFFEDKEKRLAELKSAKEKPEEKK